MESFGHIVWQIAYLSSRADVVVFGNDGEVGHSRVSRMSIRWRNERVKNARIAVVDELVVGFPQ